MAEISFWLTIDRLDADNAEFINAIASGITLTISRDHWKTLGTPSQIEVDVREV